MLIPQEKPYLQGLNSYYLIVDRFVEHLQGEIGSGCIHFSSPALEILIYFDERGILRGVLQRVGKKAKVCSAIEPLLSFFKKNSFLVNIYRLAPHSIFFWSQLPCFERAKDEFKTSNIALPDLISRLVQNQFSGFLKVNFIGKDRGALLFLNKGKMTGGSYPWGCGGLDPSRDEYNKLCKILKTNPAIFKLGQFINQGQFDILEQDATTEQDQKEELAFGIENFLTIFTETVNKNKKRGAEPELLLRQQFLDNVNRYPFLDPFQLEFEYKHGKVNFSGEKLKDNIAIAVIDCVWNVIEECKLEKKFRQALEKWDYKTVMEKKGFSVMR